MTKIVSDPEPFLHAILNKQNTFLSSESTYMKVFLDSPQLQENQKDIPLYLFSSAKQIYNYCSQLSVANRLLIQTLTPGPIQIVLNGNGKLGNDEKFIAYVPESQRVLSVLDNCSRPLRAEFISSNSSVGLNDLQNLLANEDLVVLQDDILNVRVLPTLIDCSSNVIEVFRPGVISYDELRSILPKNTKLTRNYNPCKSEFDLKIQEVSKIDHDDKQMTIVLGTKESLQEAFSLHFLDYFHHKQMGNFILFNIGSITSSQNIAVNLHKNLEEITRFGVRKVQIMKQSWPKNKWGEIISHYFDGLVLPESVDQNSSESIGKLNLVTAQA
ncbi:MAG: hypothetical protein WCK98_02975 [bacterium]